MGFLSHLSDKAEAMNEEAQSGTQRSSDKANCKGPEDWRQFRNLGRRIIADLET